MEAGVGIGQHRRFAGGKVASTLGSTQVKSGQYTVSTPPVLTLLALLLAVIQGAGPPTVAHCQNSRRPRSLESRRSRLIHLRPEHSHRIAAIGDAKSLGGVGRRDLLHWNLGHRGTNIGGGFDHIQTASQTIQTECDGLVPRILHHQKRLRDGRTFDRSEEA